MEGSRSVRTEDRAERGAIAKLTCRTLLINCILRDSSGKGGR